jgi:Bacterial Ig-like domain (group 3)
MSEKIYAWLLRLYPSNFQKAYGEEALQLFRDRARDERGFLSGLRLWLDLLGDLAISLPREYRSVSSPVVVSQSQRLWDGTPSFHTLNVETFSFRSLFYGGVASLVVYGSIWVLLGHGGNLLANPARDSQRTLRSSEMIPRRPPTIILSYMPAKPTTGSMVKLTATVSAVGGPTPTGSVRFFDGITVLNMGDLDDGTVTVKGKLPHSATHTLRATYLGDAKYSPVSSTEEKQ